MTVMQANALHAAALISALVLSGCDNSLEPSDLAGTWTATTLGMTPQGQSHVNVLAGGGSLTLVIETNGTTSGTLIIPATVSPTPLNVSMAGTVAISGTFVEFDQTADTFVRDLRFLFDGHRLLWADNQAAGTARYTVHLTRQ